MDEDEFKKAKEECDRREWFDKEIRQALNPSGESARAINEKAVEEHRRLEYLDYQARNNFPDWDKFKRAWIDNLLHEDKELCDLYMGKTILSNPLDVKPSIVFNFINAIRENNLDPMQAFSVVLKALAESAK